MPNQPPKDELEKLIRSQKTQYGASRESLVLAGPTLEEVEAAIAAGPYAELTFRVVATSHFQSVIAHKNSATIRTKLSFKDLTVTHVGELKTDSHGRSEFTASLYEYGDWYETHQGWGRARSTSSESYRFVLWPGLNTPYTYEHYGFSHGTQYEDDLQEDMAAAATA